MKAYQPRINDKLSNSLTDDDDDAVADTPDDDDDDIPPTPLLNTDDDDDDDVAYSTFLCTSSTIYLIWSISWLKIPLVFASISDWYCTKW